MHGPVAPEPFPGPEPALTMYKYEWTTWSHLNGHSSGTARSHLTFITIYSHKSNINYIPAKEQDGRFQMKQVVLVNVNDPILAWPHSVVGLCGWIWTTNIFYIFIYNKMEEGGTVANWDGFSLFSSTSLPVMVKWGRDLEDPGPLAGQWTMLKEKGTGLSQYSFGVIMLADYRRLRELKT